MFSRPIKELVEYFLKFPGVGPKQATRFVFYLLREDRERVNVLAEAIERLQSEVHVCGQCYKTFDTNSSTALRHGSGQALRHGSPQSLRRGFPQSDSGQAGQADSGQAGQDLGASHAPESGALCEICHNQRRNARVVMVVEKEVDLESIERTRKYEGLYHVLGDTISPLDSTAPARLHLRELFERVKRLSEADPLAQPASAAGDGGVEVILATNPTAEGDATALYLERVFVPLKNGKGRISVSRLGRGLTTGSELEYADEVTITNALQNRK